MGEFEVRKYRTDVLIVGGGIAGLAAAIRARRHGAEVIVLEKSHTERSGNAGSGIDHIQSYVPEVHEKVGYTENDMVNEQVNWSGNTGNLQRRDLIEIFVRNSAKDVIELEQYGLKFRFEESNTPRGYRLVPQFHFVPTSYNFEGRDIKRGNCIIQYSQRKIISDFKRRRRFLRCARSIFRCQISKHSL
ncbi:MAG: FAD-dependent oxidoreductase, partial [Clostridiales Family XIII bacterium]|nr:FAD-dependent oxidoreductase [Clostridiales Family XIII bacterium]